MSISAVRSSAETIVASVLGAPFAELPFQFNVDLNDDRRKAAGFAVTWGEASQVYEVHQSVMLQQTLRVVITKRVFVRNDDDAITTKLASVYDLIETLIPRFVTDRLDIPQTILTAKLASMSEPSFFGEGRDIASIELNFQLVYKL